MRLKIFGRIIYVPSWVKFVLILIAFIILAIIGYNIRSGKDITRENPNLALLTSKAPETTDKIGTTSTPITTHRNTPSPTEKQTITVYIVGCVKTPSVVKVPYGSIIQDAVNAAGGLTKDADPSRINMAYSLSDNMMIKIPSLSDKDENMGSAGEEWIITSVPKNTPTVSQGDDIQSTDKKTNINTADIKELCLLPGIGESTAQKIINYRKEHGSFEYIEDIMKVPGIKQSRFYDIKDMITVG